MISQTRKISEGAMMVAVVGLLLFLNRQLAGMIEYLMQWILTFPILIYCAKYGIKQGMVPSVCMLLLSFMLGTPTTIFYMFCCVVSGFVYGGGIRKEWKNGTLLIYTFLFTLFSYIITFYLFASFFGYDASEDAQIISLLLSMFHLESSMPIGNLILMITILSTVLMSLLQTMCIHMIANLLLTRLKIQVRAMKPIWELTLPKVTGLLILVIWLLFYMQNVLKLNQELSGVVFALYLSAMLVAIAYGALSFMTLCLLTKKKAGVFIIMILIFIPYVQQVIAVVGVIDMLMDMKQKMKRGVLRGSFRKF